MIDWTREIRQVSGDPAYYLGPSADVDYPRKVELHRKGTKTTNYSEDGKHWSSPGIPIELENVPE